MTGELLHFDNNLYQVNKIRFETETVTANIDLLCQYYNASKVLRKEGRLYFLELIEDAEVIAWLPKENELNLNIKTKHE
jgi:hypothetical protein